MATIALWTRSFDTISNMESGACPTSCLPPFMEVLCDIHAPLVETYMLQTKIYVKKNMEVLCNRNSLNHFLNKCLCVRVSVCGYLQPV
ncbi:unnamed protein product, partial [Nesidiocoris tenuis]